MPKHGTSNNRLPSYLPHSRDEPFLWVLVLDPLGHLSNVHFTSVTQYTHMYRMSPPERNDMLLIMLFLEKINFLGAMIFN